MSLFFNLICPAPGQERAAAHEWAQGAYAEHQWLWRFFPAPDGSARDFLFRRAEVGGLPRWYVVSRRPPENPSPKWEVASRDYAPKIRVGQRLRFDLRANPVVSTRNSAGKAVRHDVVMQEKKRLLRQLGLARWEDWRGADKPSLPELVRRACGNWLLARTEGLGFEVEDESLRAEGYTQHRGKKDEIRFSSVDLTGELRVRSPNLFTAALATGVGHSKAFGCGLLLVRPVS